MIWRCEIEFHQFKDRLEEALSLPTCQPVYGLDCGHSLNRHVGICLRSGAFSVDETQSGSYFIKCVLTSAPCIIITSPITVLRLARLQAQTYYDIPALHPGFAVRSIQNIDSANHSSHLLNL